MEEKRKHKRIQRQFIARFQVRPHGGEESEGWDIVTVRNLSAGGLLFNYDRKLEPGSLLDIKINFPASEKPVECAAKVLRINEEGDYGILYTAVFFTTIGAEEMKQINDVAEKLHLGEPTGTTLDLDWS